MRWRMASRRRSGGAALVNLHSAIGVGHGLGSLFTAYRNQTPLVVIAGQQARSLLPLEPFLYSEQATNLPRPYVKWSCEPARAEDVPAAVARAYYVAMQPPRGPTFVSVPVDDWDRHCEPVAAREVGSTVSGDPALLQHAGERLAAAQHPVFVVGASVARDGAWQEVIALAEQHQAPVWVSPLSSRNSFPELHPLFAGFLPADRARLVATLKGCDLVLVLGAPVFTYHIEGAGPHIPAGACLIQLTDDPAAAARAPVGVSIVTDLRLGIRALGAVRGAGAHAPGNAPARAAAAAGSSERWLSPAADCGPAACRQHCRGGSPQQPPGAARAPAVPDARLLLHLRKWRPRPRTASRGGHRPGTTGTQGDQHPGRRLCHVCHPGSVERRGTRRARRLRDHQQRQLSRAR